MPPTPHLTKSAFTLARTCPTKLYYYRSSYPSRLTNDPYLEFLADGGHMLGKLAQLLYPTGILIDSHKGSDLDLAVASTERELKKDKVILFEAALRAGNKLVLVDILEKIGNNVKLIEVKSKSYDGDKDREYKDKGKRTFFINTKNEIDSDWKEYLEDVCYQTYVGTLSHPEFRYIPYLFLPDKSKSTSIDGLASMFSIVEEVDGAGKRCFEVKFSGDVSRVRLDHFMTLINVEEPLKLISDEVKEAAEGFDLSLSPILKKIPPVIGRHCSKCEYNTSQGGKCGYDECWGALGRVKPHIFDLYRGTGIQKGELFDSLISKKKTSLFDVPLSELSGAYGIRQDMQIRHTQCNTEWFAPGLRSIIESLEYPAHFIDFETSRVVIPYHAGMRPYEQIAFQFSRHTINESGAEPIHGEWINVQDGYPNFEFVRALREQIGDTGSVLTWSRHEASVLKDISAQIGKYGQEERDVGNNSGDTPRPPFAKAMGGKPAKRWPPLSRGDQEWISTLVDEDNGRIIDLNRVTLDNYFHPQMKGRTSLKAVLPAIWNNHPELHEIAWFKKYVSYDGGDVANVGDGAQRVIDPYKVLSEIEIAGKAEVVEEGTGAMRAYQDMMYGKTRDDPETKAKWKALLLQYCELDTIAMLVVWTCWERAVVGAIKAYRA